MIAELPSISNRPLYVYRVLGKWLSFFIFGLSSLILVSLIFPPMRLFIHPKDKFMRYSRRFVSFSLGGFVNFMHLIRIVDVEAENRESYRNLSSKIVAVNHPSLLDVIILFSLIPNADCIVNAYLNHSILRGVVRQLYILNSLNFEELSQACTNSLNQGNCLIIFPEGTRTPRSGQAKIKRGAAHISLVTGRNIIPVHIGGTDKYGLGKRDPWTGFNPRERYVYRIEMGDEIKPEKYRSLSSPLAARAMTREISGALFNNSMPAGGGPGIAGAGIADAKPMASA